MSKSNAFESAFLRHILLNGAIAEFEAILAAVGKQDKNS